MAKPLLPEGYDTQPKRGFGMPFAEWLRGPLRDTLDETLSDASVRRRGLLDATEVAAVRAEFHGGSQDWSRPWLLMMLELWSREVLDAAPETLWRNAPRRLNGVTASRPNAA